MTNTSKTEPMEIHNPRYGVALAGLIKSIFDIGKNHPTSEATKALDKAKDNFFSQTKKEISFEQNILDRAYKLGQANEGLSTKAIAEITPENLQHALIPSILDKPDKWQKLVRPVSHAKENASALGIAFKTSSHDPIIGKSSKQKILTAGSIGLGGWLVVSGARMMISPTSTDHEAENLARKPRSKNRRLVEGSLRIVGGTLLALGATYKFTDKARALKEAKKLPEHSR